MIGVGELRGAVDEGATPHLSGREILPVGIADGQEPVSRILITREFLFHKSPPAQVAVFQVRAHEIVLGGKVGVEGHLRNPGPLGYRADPGSANAVLVEELAGRCQQLPPRLRLVPRPHRFLRHNLTILNGIYKYKDTFLVAELAG
jgi:hypothetical protein